MCCSREARRRTVNRQPRFPRQGPKCDETQNPTSLVLIASVVHSFFFTDQSPFLTLSYHLTHRAYYSAALSEDSPSSMAASLGMPSASSCSTSSGPAGSKGGQPSGKQTPQAAQNVQGPSSTSATRMDHVHHLAAAALQGVVVGHG